MFVKQKMSSYVEERIVGLGGGTLEVTSMTSVPMLTVRPHVQVSYTLPDDCSAECAQKGGHAIVQNNQMCVCMIPSGNQTQLIWQQ